MTSDERLQFINELAETVLADIFAKVDAMPEEWDGIELRRYIADRFEDQVVPPLRRTYVGGINRYRRLRAYESECLVRNL